MKAFSNPKKRMEKIYITVVTLYSFFVAIYFFILRVAKRRKKDIVGKGGSIHETGNLKTDIVGKSKFDKTRSMPLVSKSEPVASTTPENEKGTEKPDIFAPANEEKQSAEVPPEELDEVFSDTPPDEDNEPMDIDYPLEYETEGDNAAVKHYDTATVEDEVAAKRYDSAAEDDKVAAKHHEATTGSEDKTAKNDEAATDNDEATTKHFEAATKSEETTEDEATEDDDEETEEIEGMAQAALASGVLFEDLGNAVRTVIQTDEATSEEKEAAGKTLLEIRQTDMFEQLVSENPDKKKTVSELMTESLAAFYRKKDKEAGISGNEKKAPDNFNVRDFA